MDGHQKRRMSLPTLRYKDVSEFPPELKAKLQIVCTLSSDDEMENENKKGQTRSTLNGNNKTPRNPPLKNHFGDNQAIHTQTKRGYSMTSFPANKQTSSGSVLSSGPKHKQGSFVGDISTKGRRHSVAGIGLSSSQTVDRKKKEQQSTLMESSSKLISSQRRASVVSWNEIGNSDLYPLKEADSLPRGSNEFQQALADLQNN